MQLHSQHQIEQLRSEIRSHAMRQTEQSKNSQILVKTLHDLTDESKRVANEERILESLIFDELKRRFIQVKKAHPTTFEWMLEDSGPASYPPTRFKNWLRSQNGIYWICGKAGSGKSTLMKFLSSHPSTKKHLGQWARDVEPVIISWFFWSAGSPMQRSQEGLLRSLLYQILRRYPRLIPQVCPKRWDDDSIYDQQSDPWSLEELSDTIKVLSQLHIPEARFCLFIDGLDEYDGLPNNIIRVLKSLAKSTSFKLCVSSRPWNEFKDAFGEGRCDGSILLENFTRRDIERFVKDILEKDEIFTAKEQRDGRYALFVTDVIDRANGVFLWVELVVNRLLRGLGEGNRLDDLRKRLESMPPTLEEYFQKMIDKIDRVDETESAQYLLIAVHALRPLSIAAYYFLEQEEKHPGTAKRAPVQPMSQDQLLNLCKDVLGRLNFLCRDLIQTESVIIDDSYTLDDFNTTDEHYKDYNVGFLHRTVKDFLMTKDMHQLLLQRATQDRTAGWDTYRSLCNAMLARVKRLPLQKGIKRRLTVLFPLVDEFLFCAHKIEVEQKYTDTELLDQLDQVISSFASADMAYHWTNARGGPRGTFFDEHNQSTFLGLAVQSRLKLYVNKKLEANPNLLQAKQGRPYLDYALRPNIETLSGLPHLIEFIDIDLVRLLLNKGADPNQKVPICDNLSVWGIFLLHIREMRRDSNTNDILFQAAEVMIRKGADRKLNLVPSTRIGMYARESGKTAKHQQTRSKAMTVEIEVPVQLPARRILRTFGYRRADELEAITPETQNWGIGSFLSGIGRYLPSLS